MIALQYRGAMIVALFIDIVIVLYAGLAFQSMWGWFIVPAFSVAELSFMVATGLVIVAAMLTAKVKIPEYEQDVGEMMKEGIYKAFQKIIQISTYWIIAVVIVAVL